MVMRTADRGLSCRFMFGFERRRFIATHPRTAGLLRDVPNQVPKLHFLLEPTTAIATWKRDNPIEQGVGELSPQKSRDAAHQPSSARR